MTSGPLLPDLSSARGAAPPSRGLVVWLTGLPSAGKSTLARAVAERLRPRGVAVALLDGDEVRSALRPEPGYAPADRDAFYATLAGLAALLARQGLVAIVAATAHRREFRARARARSPAFLEIFVDTPLDECRRRDAKGLYARAVPSLPGATEAYERPERADFIVAPGDAAPDAALAEGILASLSAQKP